MKIYTCEITWMHNEGRVGTYEIEVEAEDENEAYSEAFDDAMDEYECCKVLDITVY